jgi:hypothetical protein
MEPGLPGCPFDLRSTLCFHWLILLTRAFAFTRIHFRAGIQLSRAATLTCEDCIFEAPEGRPDACVDVGGRSRATFLRCTFRAAQKASLFLHSSAHAALRGCAFQSSGQASVVLCQSSLEAEDCDFAGAAYYLLFADQGSRVAVQRSGFHHSAGRAVLLDHKSNVSLSGCQFQECGHGGVSASRGSSASVQQCTFTSITGVCIRGQDNSTLAVAECDFSSVKGNGVLFDFSQGSLRDSQFSGFTLPVIAAIGRTANPTVVRSTVVGCESNAVIARDASAPIFRYLTVSRVHGHGFAISQFSRAVVSDCVLSQIRGAGIAAFDGAQTTVSGNRGEALDFKTLTADARILSVKAMDDDGALDRLPLVTFEELDNFRELTPGTSVDCQSAEANHILVPCGHLICKKCPVPAQCQICGMAATGKVPIVPEPR